MAEESKEKETKEKNSQEVNAKEKKQKSKGVFSKLGIIKIPLLIVIVLLLAFASGLAITKVAKGNDSKTEAKKAEKEKKEIGKFFSLDPFTVNLVGGVNYLQVGVAFEIKSDNTELEAELKERKPQINDVIITILSSKTIEDIETTQGREKLKLEMKNKVDSLLSYGKIERVYFTTFIMQ